MKYYLGYILCDLNRGDSYGKLSLLVIYISFFFGGGNKKMLYLQIDVKGRIEPSENTIETYGASCATVYLVFRLSYVCAKRCW